MNGSALLADVVMIGPEGEKTEAPAGLPSNTPCTDEIGRMSALMPQPMVPVPVTSRHGIDVWLTYYDEIADDRQIASLRLLLNAEEVDQERRFYFADDRKRYLVTRAMVRTLLSRYAPVEPGSWVFSKNAYGRPEIAGSILDAQPQARDLSFNISHTRGLIALAVTRGRELGVDVENVTTRSISLDVADRFFSATEADELSRVPPPRQQDRFFEYWTFKESYIKARGMGLSLPLDGFSFKFPDQNAVRINIHPDLNDHAERWNFWQFRPSPDYLMAICAERSQGAPAAISMRKFSPLGSELPLATKFLRSSEAY